MLYSLFVAILSVKRSQIYKLAYLENLGRETVSPSELAMLLGGRPYIYNIMAKDGSLTLPYIWRGRNLRVFKEPVLNLLLGNVTSKKP